MNAAGRATSALDEGTRGVDSALVQLLSGRAIRLLSRWLPSRGTAATASKAVDSRASLEGTRRRLSETHLAGDGIEIGALHCPLWTSDRARVRYVDRLDLEGLRAHYPELSGQALAPVDIVDDGETLASIADHSLDFIIANHQLEHCENPLGTLRCHLRKLKPRGRLYYAIPDRRFTFDADRELVSFEHMVEDDREGPERSRQAHYREWSRLVNKQPTDEAVELEAQQLQEMRYSIHFHVWDFERFGDFLERAQSYLDHPFHVLELVRNHEENVAILQEG